MRALTGIETGLGLVTGLTTEVTERWRRDWYERELPGLGARFRQELDIQIERITTNPQQFLMRLKDVRAARLRRFPYSLFFRATDGEVAIFACYHSSRDPMIWRGRAWLPQAPP